MGPEMTPSPDEVDDRVALQQFNIVVAALE